jgi:hypothetical protein
MEVLGRFDGRNGEITIAQERKTRARLHVEEGVKQGYVLPALISRLLTTASGTSRWVLTVGF